MAAVDVLEGLAPATLEEVLDVLADTSRSDLVVWAGGTALGPLLRQGLVRPRRLLVLARVGRLQEIRVNGEGGLALGSMVRLRDLERQPLVREHVPVLAAAASKVGNVRVRNAATLGGHLVHADPAQDLPPVLLVLDSVVRLRNKDRERWLPLEQFLTGPLQTAIRPDELLVEVEIPARRSWRTAFVRYTPRSPQDYPTVSVAVSLQVGPEGAVCQGARVAVGGAGPRAMRVPAAEAALVGRCLELATCEEAAAQVAASVDPWDDARGSADYKREMARLWTERLLQQLLQDASPWGRAEEKT